jgi:hypothetical protein
MQIFIFILFYFFFFPVDNHALMHICHYFNGFTGAGVRSGGSVIQFSACALTVCFNLFFFFFFFFLIVFYKYIVICVSAIL